MTTDVTGATVEAIRAGFIGGGVMAGAHSRAARAARAELVLLASSSASRAVEAAAALGIGRAADDAAELLSSDCEVVHICTPNASHAEMSLQALAAGKHVICEKPLAIDLEDAMELAREAADRGVVTAVPFVYRYHPMVREARARVAAGELGALLSLDCGYLQDWLLLPTDDDWRMTVKDGGPSRAFADIGSHLCDLLEFVAGERIVRLLARTRRVYDERRGATVENEDIVALLVEMESGAIGTLLISQMAAGRKNSLTLELHGARSSLRFDQERPEELWIGERKESKHLFRDPTTAHPGVARFSMAPAGHAQGYQDAFNAFTADVYDAVRGGEPGGLPTFTDGVRAVQLTEAVLASARDGDWIEVPVLDIRSTTQMQAEKEAV